jgi:hypothetical protein
MSGWLLPSMTTLNVRVSATSARRIRHRYWLGPVPGEAVHGGQRFYGAHGGRTESPGQRDRQR